MKEKETVFHYDGKDYKAIFNLNVMQEIQEKYGSIDEWGKLTNEASEPDVKALIFGIKSMMNEAIDIENEKLEEKKSFLTDKQVGRIITQLGLEEATAKLHQTVVNSTEVETLKNE